MFTSPFGLVRPLRPRRGPVAVRRAARSAAGAMLETLESRELLSATVLDSSAHSTVYGQGVTLTAFVTGAGAGSVSFLEGTTTLGTAALDAAGKATLFTSTLPVGNHPIVASYAGDAAHPGSVSAPLTQVVNPAVTATTLTSAAGMVATPVLRPDHVVIVIEEDNASGAFGDANMPYFNQLAASGLVYNNAHGVNAQGQFFGELNYLALFSGSTQGITDDGPLYALSADNLARSLAAAGLSFTGYAESLPSAGDVTTVFAPSGAVPDAYARYYNPMAMFTDVGAGKTNADVNKPFTSFPSDYSTLPTVSFVIPNRLHNTHGSNEVPPFHGDPDTYNPLRHDADIWLHDNMDGYLQWAKTHNSLLIVTGESGNRTLDFAAGSSTVINGDPRLFVGGVNSSFVTHYNVLHTIEAMYGLAPIGDTATAAVLDTNAAGKLTPGGPLAVTLSAGQSATYSVNVAPIAPATGMPTGTVQFLVDGANYGTPVTLVSGAATVTVAGLSAGTHVISATYGGSTSFSGGASRKVTQNVNAVIAATTTALASSAPSAAAGVPVTLTATVANVPAGGAAATGTVTFKDGTGILGTGALDASGKVSLTLASLATGSHSITAVYGGDAAHSASTSAALSQVITPAATGVSLTSSAASAAAGQPVTLTATVTNAVAGGAVATGTVLFKDGAVALGTATLDATGKASLTSAALAVGSHSITAIYNGDAGHAGSTSPALTQVVTPGVTSVGLTSNAASVAAGQAVTLTATVARAGSGAVAPTGLVTFREGATVLGTGTLNAAGQATLTTTALPVGTHFVTATYAGDANSSGGTSPVLTQVVVPNPTTISLTTSAASVTVGQNVVFTAAVGSAAGALRPGGTVTFYDGATRLGSAALDAGGRASFATAALTVGSHAMTALYSGDSNFSGSLSAAVTQTVLALPPATAPANDKFAQRATLVGPAATATGTNVGGTREAGEPSHGGSVASKSVWWSWKAASTGLVTIETLGSTFKTVLGVYTGTGLASLNRVSGVPVSVGGAATFTFVARAGQTYQIAVDGQGGASGNINLRVRSWTAPKPTTGGAGYGSEPEKKGKKGKRDKKH